MHSFVVDCSVRLKVVFCPHLGTLIVMDWHASFWMMLLVTIIASSIGQSLETSLLRKIESDWPVGDIRLCQEYLRKNKLDVKSFEVMPGFGWDNLRNLEAGEVVSYNYTLCKQTDDGRYFIPDNVVTVPIKFSSVETFAELYDHWLNALSTTSNSINLQAGLSVSKVSVSGSFSYDNEQLKSKQIEDKAMTTRVQVRYYRYEAKLKTDPVLSPQFKKRLLSIAANIQINNNEQARYEGQLLVRDFGTHVLTSVTAGAALVKDDYLKREFVKSQSEKKSSILAAASASFSNIFKMSASFGHKTDSKTAETYDQMMTHSYIKSHGGPLFQAANMTINDWVNGVDDNLVPMDRTGDPLYFLVTPTLLPELPVTIVGELEYIVRHSIELYYEMNTISGCTKLESPNFSFSANFDDGSCHSKPTNLTFGGVYQVCSVTGQFLYHNPCDGLSSVNPKTGGYSCPPSYKVIQLHSMPAALQTEYTQKCKWHIGKHKWGCKNFPTNSQALYTMYWCAATGKVEKESGYLFGGVYTSSLDNLVTGTKGCPPSFYTRRLFKDLDVCISDDYEMGEAHSVPFGGFFSCTAGNPLAAHSGQPKQYQASKPQLLKLESFMEAQPGSGTYPSRCPEGYSQHLAADELGCAIHYCVQTGALSGPQIAPIRRPPFTSKPAVIIEPNDQEVMFDFETKTWTKNETVIQLQAKSMLTSQVNEQDSVKGMSPGVIAGISVCATLVIVAIATLITVMIRRKRARRQSPYKCLNTEYIEPATSYGSTADETTAINMSTT